MMKFRAFYCADKFVILSLWRSIHKIKVYLNILMDFSFVSLTQNDKGLFVILSAAKYP